LGSYKQGFFKPLNPKKYKGDVHNIVYRSSWELKLYSILDNREDILEWSSEEIVIPYISPKDNRRHRYFPDVLIRLKDENGNIKTTLIEIKPLSQTLPPIKKSRLTKGFINEVMTYAVNMAKFEAAKSYCEKKGWDFKVMTEVDLGIK
jgi:hypothetical protein